MRGPGGHPDEYRGVELLAQLKGNPHEFFCLLAVGWLKHGNFGELGVVAVILLIL